MSAIRSPSLVLALVLALGASSALAASADGGRGGQGGSSGNSPGGGSHVAAVLPGQQDTCRDRNCPPFQPLRPQRSTCHGGTFQQTPNGDEHNCRRDPIR